MCRDKVVLALILLIVRHGQPKSVEDLQDGLRERLEILDREVRMRSNCSFWVGIYKLHAGDDDFCAEELSHEALFVEADSLVGFAWALGNNASFARMSSRLRTDLLARLTTMPFWLNHGGKFERGDRVLDHWSEARQIAWLTGGYVVGDAFTKDANRSDIVFSSIDHTGLILKLESKQRIWRWLDHRQGCGLTGLDSAAVTALITLAALVDGSRMATLASMVLWLAFYEIKSSTWKGNLLSPKVASDSVDDFKALIWLLTGYGDFKVAATPSALILAMALRDGFELPPIFIEEIPAHPVWPIQSVSTYGTSRSDFRGIGQSSPDDCLYWFGQDGLFASLRCFVKVGNSYKLWNRHPVWNKDVKKLLSELNSKEAYKLDRLFAPFGGGLGQRKLNMFLENAFAIVSVESASPGYLMTNCDFANWRIDYEGGKYLETNQPVGDVHCGRVVPRVGQHGSTLFVMHNPSMMLASTMQTDHTVLRLNFKPDRLVSSGDYHWAIYLHGNALTAIYSERYIAWDSREISGNGADHSKRIDGSSNLWIVHSRTLESPAEKEIEFDRFTNEERHGFLNLFDRHHILRLQILHSPLAVRQSYEDDFSECLHRSRCLESGPGAFLRCLRRDCNIEHYKDTSPLATCLHDKLLSQTEDVEKLHNLSDCLSTRPLVELEAKWQLGDTVFNFGGKSDELRIWKENVEVDKPEGKFRYLGDGVSAKLNDTKIQLEGLTSALEMDFDNIAFQTRNASGLNE